MTDKELVLELCKRLGLTRVENEDTPDDNEFCEHAESIVIGAGQGYNRFYAAFYFGPDDKLKGHGVWE